MKVSFVIAVRNGAETIGETLRSLQLQTSKEWEALVVDDGSTDETAAIVGQLATTDARIRLLRSVVSEGVSEARNHGIDAARSEWLVFLDADDWVAKTYLERMTDPIREEPTLDATYCGWTFLTPDGFPVFGSQGQVTGDLFALHATECPYAIHAYLVRKSLVRDVGAFDPSLVVCEDWDLWQRFSRAGARFAPVMGVLALYRIRRGSASTDGRRTLQDGLRVLARAYSSDPRVTKGHPVYPNGLPRADWYAQQIFLLCSAAGLVLGRGEDARSLIAMIEKEGIGQLRPGSVADCVVQGAMLSAARPLSEWDEAWNHCEPVARAFLDALETWLELPSLADHALRACRARVTYYRAPLGLTARVSSAAAKLALKRLHLRCGLSELTRDRVAWIKSEIGSALRMVPRADLLFRRWSALRTGAEDGEFFERLFATEEDPWNYTNTYEEQKYNETLELLGAQRPGTALELACAEGHFTTKLATRVDSLLATDVSANAVARAALRCAEQQNVSFQELDFMNQAIPGAFDLIVCSEVLYFASSVSKLRKIASRIAEALKPGGVLLMAHGNVVGDEPSSAGFNWSHRFGAKGIGDVFASLANLRFDAEIGTDLYRVQRFHRPDPTTGTPANATPNLQRRLLPSPLPEIISSQVLWSGMGEDLRILMYHRVSETGSEALSPWRVTPQKLSAQLSWLRESGYQGITLEEWLGWRDRGDPIPAKSVHLSFDDGYLDFLTDAWPLLAKFGFPVTVFLVAEEIGGENRWDRDSGERVPLLKWPQIRELQREGVRFGSHTVSHPSLTQLSHRAVRLELLRSKTTLEQGLGCAVDALAYPYGESSPWIRYVAARAGYRYAVTCEEGTAQSADSLFALPRIEVEGSDDLVSFAAKIKGDR